MTTTSATASASCGLRDAGSSGVVAVRCRSVNAGKHGALVTEQSVRVPTGRHALVVDLATGAGPQEESGLRGADLRPLLREVVAAVQEAISAARQAGASLNVVLVLDADATMGDAEGLTEEPFWEAALAGACLSLSRTLAVELRKHGDTVNAVMVGVTPAEGGSDLRGAGRQVTHLLEQGHPIITGQQIFADSGRGGGRLRP